ncbi:MAG: putative lipoprotein [Halieaceae bacterium]|jgi:putative lipoprotein
MKIVGRMLRFTVPALLLISLAAITGCEGGGDSETLPEGAMAKIEGIVVYRERVMLRAGSELEIQLQDVSRPDAMASVLATVIMTPEGGPPFPFVIDFQPAQINEGKHYALRATIRRRGKLIFTNTDYIDPFATNPVEVMVSAVPDPVASAALRGTTWILETLEAEAIETSVGDKPIDLLLDPDEMRLSGFTGCNRYMGPFELVGSTLNGALLSLGPLAGTRMACASDSGLEQRYLKLLVTITGYHLVNGGLSLIREDLVVATFRPE